jgi:hypothetical protein
MRKPCTEEGQSLYRGILISGPGNKYFWDLEYMRQGDQFTVGETCRLSASDQVSSLLNLTEIATGTPMDLIDAKRLQ